jgi:type V secretory pathway adhesin AidA
MGLDESEEPDFPNPIVTDANFRHYLDQATAHQGPGRIKIGSGDQAHYNAAVVHALHQLDHRTRLQQRTITRLEAELADARRALAALESNELRES